MTDCFECGEPLTEDEVRFTAHTTRTKGGKVTLVHPGCCRLCPGHPDRKNRRPMTLRDRLAEAMCLVDGDWTDEPEAQATWRLYAGAALSVLTEGIVIVTPHQSGCVGEWTHFLDGSLTIRVGADLRCTEMREGGCPAEARIPEALLVELVKARE